MIHDIACVIPGLELSTALRSAALVFDCNVFKGMSESKVMKATHTNAGSLLAA